MSKWIDNINDRSSNTLFLTKIFILVYCFLVIVLFVSSKLNVLEPRLVLWSSILALCLLLIIFALRLLKQIAISEKENKYIPQKQINKIANKFKINLPQVCLNLYFAVNPEILVNELSQTPNKKIEKIRLKAINILIEEIEQKLDNFKERKKKYNLIAILLAYGLTFLSVYLLNIDRDILKIDLFNGTMSVSAAMLLANQICISLITDYIPSKTEMTYKKLLYVYKKTKCKLEEMNIGIKDFFYFDTFLQIFSISKSTKFLKVFSKLIKRQTK